MGQRILLITLAFAFCLLGAHSSRADSIDFQSAVGSGSAQSGATQSGGARTSQGGGGSAGTQVETVDFGDVTGTVCDCGEIAPADGGANGPGAASKGFPKFPLLAFAAAPIICFSGICTTEPPTLNPPSDPPSDVPEPLTIATFAAGLAALSGLRARRRT